MHLLVCLLEGRESLYGIFPTWNIYVNSKALLSHYQDIWGAKLVIINFQGEPGI